MLEFSQPATLIKHCSTELKCENAHKGHTQNCKRGLYRLQGHAIPRLANFVRCFVVYVYGEVLKVTCSLVVAAVLVKESRYWQSLPTAGVLAQFRFSNFSSEKRESEWHGDSCHF